MSMSSHASRNFVSTALAKPALTDHREVFLVRWGFVAVRVWAVRPTAVRDLLDCAIDGSEGTFVNARLLEGFDSHLSSQLRAS
jgi:hypothetical protein